LPNIHKILKTWSLLGFVFIKKNFYFYFYSTFVSLIVLFLLNVWFNNTEQQIKTFFLFLRWNLLIFIDFFMLITNMNSKFLYHVRFSRNFMLNFIQINKYIVIHIKHLIWYQLDV
jgi:hypothetical protein